jgi:hypothetical protein
MADPTPIRADIEPTIDAAREMRDWTWDQIKAHMDHCDGMAPVSVCIVLLGPNGEGAHSFTVNSWTPTDERASRMQVCAAAAALLNQRALMS